MTLNDLGYKPSINEYLKEHDLGDFEIGRIISEHKERYMVRTESQELEAEITGNMRFSAAGREDFPAVGDWVAIMAFDANSAIIHKVLPRFSVIKRQAVGQHGEIQIIATNIDTAFVVQAVDRDFNINRIERYLTLCYDSKVSPIVVLTKADLVDDAELDSIIAQINLRIVDVPVVAVSSEVEDGYASLLPLIEPGKTYCLLGSSGVGKSTLVNALVGKYDMKTQTISDSTSKGRHTTSHRELIVLEKGGILIDNPGMREVGITDASEGLELTFDSIFQYAEQCKYKDCTHTTEDGCAVIMAVENGEVSEAAYENYLKLEREKAYFESTSADRRKKGKNLAKVIKNMKRDMKGKY